MANESIKVVATNRSARHDYFIDEVFEAGIVLMGTEVKSLRHGRATIGEGYVSIDRGEAWLRTSTSPNTRLERGPITLPAVNESCCCTIPRSMTSRSRRAPRIRRHPRGPTAGVGPLLPL